MFKYNNTKKNIINLSIVIFGLIVGLIIILLALYYLTPNNYQIIKFDENKFKLIDTHEYTLKPYLSKQITKSNIKSNPDTYYKFTNQDNQMAKTDLEIKNWFKSQNIVLNEDYWLIKSNSNIFILNNGDKEKKIIVQTYLLN